MSCAGPQKPDLAEDGPRSGHILFHQPAGASAKAFTQGYRLTDDGATESEYTHVFYGAVRGPQRTESLVEKLFDQTQGTASERAISRKQFVALLDRLESTGLFELPRWNRREPPANRSFFVVEIDGERRVYANPARTSAPPDSPEGMQRESWKNAMRAFLDGVPRVKNP